MEDVVATQRLELRPLSPAAAAALLGDREQAARELGAEIPAEWPDPDLVKLLLAHADMTSDRAVWTTWPIIDRNHRTVVGDFTFLGPPSHEGEVGIAYYIVSKCRRQGYATEAATLLIAWAQQQPGVRVITAACADDNEGSIKTLRRVGFRQTHRGGGELRWRVDRPASASATTP